MNKMKKFALRGMVALALSCISVPAFAAYNSAAEAVADLTGSTIEEVTAARRSGITYGTMASDAGKLEEFQKALEDMGYGPCNGTGNGGGHRHDGTGNGHGNRSGNGHGSGHGSCAYR